MRPSRVVVLLWVLLIAVLLVIEFAEVTHLFTLPVQSVIGDPLSFVFALVFTTILALVGAIFIGIYSANRLLSPTGFTAFEEEMLRMRKEVEELAHSVAEIHQAVTPGEPPNSEPEEDT